MAGFFSFDLPFEEAIAWAAGRVSVLPETYYRELPAAARGKAFTISGLTSIDQISTVIKSLRMASEDGSTFAEWQEWALTRPELAALPNGRLETIFRMGVQTHYGIGRTQQQRLNKKARPYFLWDAVNDSRVRDDHLAMDGYIAPIDDPIWNIWSPPAGFNCRCTRIALNERQAKARGYPMEKPDAMPDPGFDYEAADWQDEILGDIEARKLANAPPEFADRLTREKPGLIHQPQKTTEDAATWALDASLADNVDFGALDVSVANEMNLALLETLRDFPVLRSAQLFMGSYQVLMRMLGVEVKGTKAYAITANHQTIGLNEDWGKPAALPKLRAELVKDTASGYHPPGVDSVKAIMDHKFGHQLDHLLSLSSDPDVIELHREHLARGTIGNELSRYAEYSISEFIAEAWAEYRNSPAPRAIAKRIGEIIVGRYAIYQ